MNHGDCSASTGGTCVWACPRICPGPTPDRATCHGHPHSEIHLLRVARLHQALGLALGSARGGVSTTVSLVSSSCAPTRTPLAPQFSHTGTAYRGGDGHDDDLHRAWKVNRTWAARVTRHYLGHGRGTCSAVGGHAFRRTLQHVRSRLFLAVHVSRKHHVIEEGKTGR